MKKKLIFLLLACLMLCVAVPAAMAEDVPNPATDFEISTTGEGNIAIRGYKGTDPTVVIPSEIDGKPVTVIAERAFSPLNTQSTGASIVTSVVIPDSVTAIGQLAFQGCTSLESVIIPNSVTTIEQYAFQDCTSLESVIIPNSATMFSQGVFVGCTNLKSVTLPGGITSIPNSTFRDCTSLASITIPDSVTAIGVSAFQGCTSLESVIIPNSVTRFEPSAFENCTSLKSIALPNSVTVIGGSAFENCTSLESVTLPESVTALEQYVFTGCTNLATIEFLGNTPPMDGRFFWCDPDTVNVIYVPHEAVAAYQATVGNLSTDKVRCKKHDTAICPTVVTVSVSSSVGGSTTGGGTYPIDEAVTLTATPDTGYIFAGWQVSGQIVDTRQTYTFTAVKDVTVTALFTLNDYVVTVSASTGGTVQGGGSYNHGDIVTLTAVPDNGYSFAGWYVNNQLVSMDTTYSFTVTESLSVTALFEKMPVLPQTGDDSNVILWSALACISLIGMMMLVRKRKEA